MNFQCLRVIFGMLIKIYSGCNFLSPLVSEIQAFNSQSHKGGYGNVNSNAHISETKGR